MPYINQIKQKMSSHYKNKAIFFDRDGVINRLISRNDGFFSPRKFDDFYIYNDIKEAVDFLVNNNFLILIVSNQPDISRSKMKIDELNKMDNAMKSLFHIDDIYYSFDSSIIDGGTKKPLPKMLFDAKEKWKINFSSSYFIGDSLVDKQCAENASIPFIMISRDHNKNLKSDIKIYNLNEIKNFI